MFYSFFKLKPFIGLVVREWLACNFVVTKSVPSTGLIQSIKPNRTTQSKIGSESAGYGGVKFRKLSPQDIVLYGKKVEIVYHYLYLYGQSKNPILTLYLENIFLTFLKCSMSFRRPGQKKKHLVGPKPTSLLPPI